MDAAIHLFLSPTLLAPLGTEQPGCPPRCSFTSRNRTREADTTIGFFHVWNIVAGDVAQSQGLSLIHTARLFVFVNVGLHVAFGPRSRANSYTDYAPITAIQRADEDLNPETDPDLTWAPLLGTPPYPTYAGNAACLSAAAARALQLALGRDDVSFSITWTRTMGLPPVTRDFTGFWQLAEQRARSRIYGGIHFPVRFGRQSARLRQGLCVHGLPVHAAAIAAGSHRP